ncbi:Hybrid signal transduction histidine kinase G [Diplonema papillatum]|nr:Hybrid signal transduction histidine kinase G [Diplonema papillatum]
MCRLCKALSVFGRLSLPPIVGEYPPFYRLPCFNGGPARGSCIFLIGHSISAGRNEPTVSLTARVPEAAKLMRLLYNLHRHHTHRELAVALDEDMPPEQVFAESARFPSWRPDVTLSACVTRIPVRRPAESSEAGRSHGSYYSLSRLEGDTPPELPLSDCSNSPPAMSLPSSSPPPVENPDRQEDRRDRAAAGSTRSSPPKASEKQCFPVDKPARQEDRKDRAATVDATGCSPRSSSPPRASKKQCLPTDSGCGEAVGAGDEPTATRPFHLDDLGMPDAAERTRACAPAGPNESAASTRKRFARGWRHARPACGGGGGGGGTAELRVLVVDDIAVNAQVLARKLGALGVAEVHACMNSEEGFKKLSAGGTYSVVLLDDDMPGDISSREFLEHVRRSRGANAFTPFLSVVLSPSARDVRNALASGFAGCLSKPVQTRDLKVLVDQLRKRAALQTGNRV